MAKAGMKRTWGTAFGDVSRPGTGMTEVWLLSAVYQMQIVKY
jgi:hypothetical protein